VEEIYPKDWKEYKFGDVFDLGGSLSISRANLSDEGICYLHYGDIHKSSDSFIDVNKSYKEIPKYNIALEEVDSKYLLKDGDIVFADASEDYEGIAKSLTVVNKDNKPFISGLHTIVARDKGDLIDNTYKRYFLKDWEIRKQLMTLATGTSVLGISQPNLKKIKVFLPPKEEQNEIGLILSKWDKAIELKEKLIEQKKEQKTGLIETLLSGKKRIKGFNGEWKQVKLKEISHINKESLSNNTSSDYEFYYYDISSVENGNVAIQKDLIKFLDAPSRARRVFHENDILMSTVRPNLKGFAFIDFEVNDAICSTGFAVITAEEVVTNKLIYYNLFSKGIETQIEKLIVGSNYPAINAFEVGNLKIYYPLDHNERQQIVDIIYCADKELKLLQLELKFLKEQKQALMQQLLTGKIRVKV